MTSLEGTMRRLERKIASDVGDEDDTYGLSNPTVVVTQGQSDNVDSLLSQKHKEKLKLLFQVPTPEEIVGLFDNYTTLL